MPDNDYGWGIIDALAALEALDITGAPEAAAAAPLRFTGARPNPFNAQTVIEFELAAHLRDRLSAVRKAVEKQQMVFNRNEDVDVIGLHDDELEAGLRALRPRLEAVPADHDVVLDVYVWAPEPGGDVDADDLEGALGAAEGERERVPEPDVARGEGREPRGQRRLAALV